jgi:FG-GAP-like repeat
LAGFIEVFVMLDLPALWSLHHNNQFQKYSMSNTLAPSELTFNVTFNDPGGTYAPYYTAIQSNVVAAGLNWNQYIHGRGNVAISIDFTDTGSAASGRPGISAPYFPSGGIDTIQTSVSSILRTGIDTNGAGADIELNINPFYLSGPDALWYDPDPLTRTTPVPISKVDAVSVFIHEIGHALGFSGYKNKTNGTLPDNYQSTFDRQTSFDGTNFFFTGTRATAVYGGHVPLTFGNIFHLGNNAPRPGSNLLSDVMNGQYVPFGRTDISVLDLAILADIGIPTDPVRNDFNNDGKSDILWRNTDGRIALWQMNGSNLTIGSVFDHVSTNWQIASTGDFNSDRKSDILWRNTTDGSVALWQMDGSTPTTKTVIGSAPTNWQISSTGDFNGDSKADILWRNTTDGSVAIWQMNGSTPTSETVIASVTTDWKIAGTADFNNDGKCDILWRKDDGQVALWQMNGNTTLAANVIGSVSNDWKIAGTGDFNGDSNADILWRNNDGQVAIWQMNGKTVLSQSLVTPYPSVDNSWKIAGTGDFDGDRKTDILWRNDNGSVETWLMNGSTVTAANLVTPNPVVDNSWKIAAPIL